MEKSGKFYLIGIVIILHCAGNNKKKTPGSMFYKNVLNGIPII